MASPTPTNKDSSTPTVAEAWQAAANRTDTWAGPQNATRASRLALWPVPRLAAGVSS
jgi:hypothetical protein